MRLFKETDRYNLSPHSDCCLRCIRNGKSCKSVVKFFKWQYSCSTSLQTAACNKCIVTTQSNEELIVLFEKLLYTVIILLQYFFLGIKFSLLLSISKGKVRVNVESTIRQYIVMQWQDNEQCHRTLAAMVT